MNNAMNIRPIPNNHGIRVQLLNVYNANAALWITFE